MHAISNHTSTAHSMTRRGFLATLASLAAVGTAACGSVGSTADAESGDASAAATGDKPIEALGSNPADLSAISLDPAAWSYDAENGIYYQIGAQYCAAPAATAYESMGIYVPGAYFDATDNGNGTYTCAVSESATLGAYTAATAPVVMPVNTAGYSAQEAPSSYTANGLTDYLAAGLVYVYAGCRGHSNGTNDDGTPFAGGAPWGVTDLKAAIRCLRFNGDKIPGGAQRVFTFGHSGGGAQSALVGATGDSALYAPYLESIGAVFCDEAGSAISDATTGAMCWCPITSLDVADEAYEWMMGQYASTGTRAEGTWTDAFSGDLSQRFAEYVNGMGFVDAQGNALELTEGGEGIWTSGSYYDYLQQAIEGSLNDFLASTEFPYTPSSQTMADGGFGGGGASGGTAGDKGRPGRPDGRGHLAGSWRHARRLCGRLHHLRHRGRLHSRPQCRRGLGGLRFRYEHGRRRQCGCLRAHLQGGHKGRGRLRRPGPQPGRELRLWHQRVGRPTL